MNTKYDKLNLISEKHNFTFADMWTKLAVLFKIPTEQINKAWHDHVGEFTHEEMIKNVIPHLVIKDNELEIEEYTKETQNDVILLELKKFITTNYEEIRSYMLHGEITKVYPSADIYKHPESMEISISIKGEKNIQHSVFNLITKSYCIDFKDSMLKIAALFKIPEAFSSPSWLNDLEIFTSSDIINNLMPHITKDANGRYDIFGAMDPIYQGNPIYKHVIEVCQSFIFFNYLSIDAVYLTKEENMKPKEIIAPTVTNIVFDDKVIEFTNYLYKLHMLFGVEIKTFNRVVRPNCRSTTPRVWLRYLAAMRHNTDPMVLNEVVIKNLLPHLRTNSEREIILIGEHLNQISAFRSTTNGILISPDLVLPTMNIGLRESILSFIYINYWKIVEELEKRDCVEPAAPEKNKNEQNEEILKNACDKVKEIIRNNTINIITATAIPFMNNTDNVTMNKIEPTLYTADNIVANNRVVAANLSPQSKILTLFKKELMDKLITIFQNPFQNEKYVKIMDPEIGRCLKTEIHNLALIGHLELGLDHILPNLESMGIKNFEDMVNALFIGGNSDKMPSNEIITFVLPIIKSIYEEIIIAKSKPKVTLVDYPDLNITFAEKDFYFLSEAWKEILNIIDKKSLYISSPFNIDFESIYPKSITSFNNGSLFKRSFNLKEIIDEIFNSENKCANCKGCKITPDERIRVLNEEMRKMHLKGLPTPKKSNNINEFKQHENNFIFVLKEYLKISCSNKPEEEYLLKRLASYIETKCLIKRDTSALIFQETTRIAGQGNLLIRHIGKLAKLLRHRVLDFDTFSKLLLCKISTDYTVREYLYIDRTNRVINFNNFNDRDEFIVNLIETHVRNYLDFNLDIDSFYKELNDNLLSYQTRSLKLYLLHNKLEELLMKHKVFGSKNADLSTVEDGFSSATHTDILKQIAGMKNIVKILDTHGDSRGIEYEFNLDPRNKNYTFHLEEMLMFLLGIEPAKNTIGGYTYIYKVTREYFAGGPFNALYNIKLPKDLNKSNKFSLLASVLKEKYGIDIFRYENLENKTNSILKHRAKLFRCVHILAEIL